MPTVSKKQHNFMAAVANNSSFAKKAKVPQSVGSEFINADKLKKRSTSPKARIAKPKTRHGKSSLF